MGNTCCGDRRFRKAIDAPTGQGRTDEGRTDAVSGERGRPWYKRAKDGKRGLQRDPNIYAAFDRATEQGRFSNEKVIRATAAPSAHAVSGPSHLRTMHETDKVNPFFEQRWDEEYKSYQGSNTVSPSMLPRCR